MKTGANKKQSGKYKIKSLGVLSKKLLRRKGRLDSKKGIIRLLDGHYTSPFIVQETHICISQILFEKARLQNILFPMTYSIARNNNKFNTPMCDEVSYKIILENDNIRSNLSIKKETLGIKHQCEEIYNYLIARLSVYWDGVLLEQSKTTDYPPIFDADIILKSIVNEIDSIIPEELQ